MAHQSLSNFSSLFLLTIFTVWCGCFSTCRGQNAPTLDEFTRAIHSNGFHPPGIQEKYRHFVNGLSTGHITSKREAAMALAQFLHESGGLIKKREDGCPGGGHCNYQGGPGWPQDVACKQQYPHNQYYGRGYIQLTYCANYRDLGHRLGYGDELARNPDRVSNDEGLAWGVSFAYWAREVHGKDGVAQGRFGVTTRAINGALECDGKRPDLVQARFTKYVNVHRAFNLAGQPNPDGC